MIRPWRLISPSAGTTPSVIAVNLFLVGLARPFPAFDGHLLGTCQGELPIGRVLGDGAARASSRVLADTHRSHQHVAGADEGAIFDGGGGLVHPIVVAG